MEVEAGMVGLLVGEETWSLVIGLWLLEAKPAGMGSLEKKWRDWCVREVAAAAVVVVVGERHGMVVEAIGVIRWKRKRRRRRVVTWLVVERVRLSFPCFHWLDSEGGAH